MYSEGGEKYGLKTRSKISVREEVFFSIRQDDTFTALRQPSPGIMSGSAFPEDTLRKYSHPAEYHPGTIPFSRPYSAELASLFFKLAETLKLKENGYALRADGLLQLILAALVKISSGDVRRIRNETPDYCAEVRRFIETNYQRKISVKDIAESIGLERSYLSTLFAQGTGSSIKRSLIEYRIGKARELLRSTAWTVQEIAASVGYDEYATFEKRFRLETGQSPTEFRHS